MTDKENLETVSRALHALMTGGSDHIADLFTPNAVLHQCGFLQPIPMSAVLRGDVLRGGRIENRHVQILQMIGRDDVVALHWSMSGTYSDPDSATLDGQAVTVPGMGFVRLEQGKIAEIWNIRDSSTLQSQLDEIAEAAGSDR